MNANIATLPIMSTGRLLFAVCLACVIAGCKGSAGTSSSTTGSASTNPSSSSASSDATTPSGTTTADAGSSLQSAPPAKSNGKTYSLVGQWVPSNSPKGATIPTVTITKDQLITELTAPAPDKKGTLSQKNVNSYQLQGTQLTMKPVSMVRSTNEASFKDKVTQFNAAVAKSLSKAKPATVQITWQDKDHFSFVTPSMPGPNGQTVPPQTVSFKRKS